MYRATKRCLLFLAIVLSLTAFGQSKFKTIEQDALPSDRQSLNNHIKKSLTYPQDARLKRISGIVYVQFEVDENGYFRKNSVKTFSGLWPSCDREAERVIKSYTEKWNVDSNSLIGRYVCKSSSQVCPASFFNGMLIARAL